LIETFAKKLAFTGILLFDKQPGILEPIKQTGGNAQIRNDVFVASAAIFLCDIRMKLTAQKSIDEKVGAPYTDRGATS